MKCTNMEILTLENIRELVSQTETGQIEFKETTGQLERAMETLCAFLNGKGGTILFGVTDKGKIIGQEVSDQTKRIVADALQRLEPLAAVEISYIPLPDNSEKKIIVIHVEEQRYTRPFTYKGRPYIRIESTTSTMSQSTYNQLLMQRDEVRFGWEALINEDLKQEDLDKDEILKTVRLGIESGRLPESTALTDITIILEKLKLSKNGQLKNAAAVLFADDTSNYPQCLLRMARFRGINKEEFIDNQRIYGNIFKLLDAAMTFFFKHLSLSGKINSVERVEELNVPVKALREGIINALCHRQYHSPGGSVGIAIYDDRIEIENIGTFPTDISIENLKSEHRSEPQNPLIADVLYKRKVLESWGRGIGLMINECKRVELPEPEFHTNGNFVWVIFRYANQVSDQVSDQVKSLLSIIGQETLLVTEIMERLSLNHRTYFRKHYLNPALQAELIAPKYPKSNHPKQRYYLTEKGKQARISFIV